MPRADWRVRWGIPVAVIVVLALGYWWLHPKPRSLGTAYISEKSVILWTTTAEVRQPAATAHYGDLVTILARQGPVAQVRNAAGVSGWMDAYGLMDPTLWQQATALLAKARGMEVQASGYAKTVTNLHIEPGRSSDRIYQFGRNVPVVILARAVAADTEPAAAAGGAASDTAAPDASQPKLEDWLLVMRDSSAAEAPLAAENTDVSAAAANAAPAADDATADAPLPMAGWVLARFIELNPPGPVRDNAQSSDLHLAAWFELNRVPGGSGDVPQYLVAGSRGEEGQTCDFTLLRVYTWDDPRQRYETAFLESDLCGKLPIHVFGTADAPEFKFADQTSGERDYVMHKTMVRRVLPNEQNARTPRAAKKK
jgi:hypothetical protein